MAMSSNSSEGHASMMSLIIRDLWWDIVVSVYCRVLEKR